MSTFIQLVKEIMNGKEVNQLGKDVVKFNENIQNDKLGQLVIPDLKHVSRSVVTGLKSFAEDITNTPAYTRNGIKDLSKKR